MSVYNLKEYSFYYSETTGRLWFCPKDQATNFNNNIENNDDFKSFKYKAKVLGNTVAQPTPNKANRIVKNATSAVSLKYLSKFLRSLEITLINCKFEINLKWAKYCLLSENGNDNANDNPNNIIFTIKDTKLCVPVVNLSAKDNQKLSKLLSQEFER